MHRAGDGSRAQRQPGLPERLRGYDARVSRVHRHGRGAGAVRRHFSRVANDFGRRLALAGDAAAARDAFDSAAAFFPGAPSALLNLASLERIAPHADAAIVAGMVHTGDWTIAQIKDDLAAAGIPVRRTW